MNIAHSLRGAFDDAAPETRRRAVALIAALVAANVLVWVLALATFAARPVLLGTALLAYTFGLRHAVDADHISAIDNVTRKLMREGKRPVAVGFFFSLGHSTIVVALSAAIALSAGYIRSVLPSLQSVGGMIGTGVSAAFLFAIAGINVVVLIEIIGTMRRVRAGDVAAASEVDDALERRGLMGRFFSGIVRATTSSRSMYPVGVLFGLGFDTATEVGLLGIAALEAGKGLPVWAIMIFPLLFTAGMCLLDTLDGILMLGAYGWAFISPQRKLVYNVNVTLVSVLVALFVGTLEVLAVTGAQLQAKGPFWDGIASLSDNFGAIGFAIVGIFVLSWAVSAILCQVRDARSEPAPVATRAR
jgi:high-affinity nickel-transport protein